VILSFSLIVGIAAIGLWILWLWRRSSTPCQVVSGEIPEILAQLEASGREGNASVLTVIPKGAPAGDGIIIQYSIHQGVVGFDWLLLGFRNVADKPRIAEMAAALGYPVEEREADHVRCLRMTGPGISDLGVAIIRDFYNVSPSTKIQMTTKGFKWSPDEHWRQA
jgi:hypothetical protein